MLPTSVFAIDVIAISLLGLMPVVVPWILGGNRVWVMGPAILVVLAVTLLFLYRYFWTSSNCDLVVPPGGFAILGFVVYLAAMIVPAEIPYEAWLETFRYISYAVVYWMWFNLLRYNKRWKWVVILLMLSVSIMALYALIQNAHGSNMVMKLERPEQYGMRASGSYICPNHFANLIGMMIPVCVGLVFYRGAGLPMRLIAGYTAAVCLPALLLTESRSGWIGLLVGLVVFAVAASIRKGIRRFLVVLIVAPVLAALTGAAVWMASPRVQARVESAIKGDIRVPLWKDSLVIAQEAPVLGSGLGSYYWQYPHFRVHYTDYANPEFAHNEYLQYWSEIGAVGLVLAAFVVLLIVRRAIRSIRRDDEGYAFLMAGMLGCMAGAFAHAFFDFNFHIYANVHVLVFIMAALMAATYDRRIDRSFEIDSTKARVVSLVVALVIAGGFLSYGRAIASYFHVEAGRRHVDAFKWDQAFREYDKAAAWSPRNWKAHLARANLLRTRSFWNRDPDTRAAWLEEARSLYDTVLAKNPWAADAVLGLAGVAKLEGNDEEALRMYRLAVEKVPRQAYYLNELGAQLKRMGHDEEALEVFRESETIESSRVAQRNIASLKKRVDAKR